MICPRCSARVAIFSAEWQAQKVLPSRHCPSCKGSVEIVFDGKRTAIWWLTSAALIGGLMVIVGVPWPLAAFFGPTFGALFAMFPTMVLSVPLTEGTGLRAALYRPLKLPTWLGSAWLLTAARMIGAVAGVVLVSGAALSYFSWPLAGLVLFALGAVGVCTRFFIVPWSQSAGPIPRLASGALLAVGVAILLYGYI